MGHVTAFLCCQGNIKHGMKGHICPHLTILSKTCGYTMPPHELAGNLLRITTTDYNLRTKNIQGEDGAIGEHFSNGRQVRQVMISMSGEKPEDIPPAPSIRKEIEARRRKAKKRLKNTPPESQDTLF